jgi:hypothetical protein
MSPWISVFCVPAGTLDGGAREPVAAVGEDGRPVPSVCQVPHASAEVVLPSVTERAHPGAGNASALHLVLSFAHSFAQVH